MQNSSYIYMNYVWSEGDIWAGHAGLSDVLKLIIHHQKHLNSTCRTDDWFPKADRTAMISQASYTLLNINTDVFCCTVHVLNKERPFLSKLFLDDSEGFMCIWKTHEIKIPEWNITESFIKPSELLKIELYKLNPNHTCFSWTEKKHIFQQSAGKTDHLCSFLCFNIWFE